jgi:hypothetical protein
MVYHTLRVIPLCTLLHTASLTEWNSDHQLQESRHYISDARVKSIQDILLLQDNYSSHVPHNPQSNEPKQGLRAHLDHSNPPYSQQYPQHDSSRYRPHNTQGYEIYEQPDLPESNSKQNAFQQPSVGYLWIPGSTPSQEFAYLQHKKHSVHHIQHRKPSELLGNTAGMSESGGVSNYPYTNMRPDKLTYQATPPQSQGTATLLSHSLPKFHAPQYLLPMIPAEVLAHLQIGQRSVNPAAALLLAASLNQLPIITA